MNQKLALFIAWISLFIGGFLIGLCVYLIPYLFNWYNERIPSELITIFPVLDNAQLSDSFLEKVFILLPFIIGGIILIIISRYSQQWLFKEREDIKEEGNTNVEVADLRLEVKNKTWLSPTIKILFAVIAVILFVDFLEYLLSVTFNLFP